MITRLQAFRYRCFPSLDVAVGPYQVLVGSNGAGKSTMLDLPLLLGDILRGKSIHDAFFKPTPSHRRPRADNPRELLYNGVGDWFGFALELRAPVEIAEQWLRTAFPLLPRKEQARLEAEPGLRARNLRYELALRIVDGALEISHEYLFLLPEERTLVPDTGNLLGLWGDFASTLRPNVRTVIARDVVNGTIVEPEVPTRVGGEQRPLLGAQIPALAGISVDVGLFGFANWLRSFLETQSILLAPNLSAMRDAQLPPGRDFIVAADATTLPWSVASLQKENEQFADWLMHVRSALPPIEAIGSQRQESDGRAFLEVTYEGQSQPVRSSGLSDGTLTVLALSILPYLHNLPALVTIEEPENGLHPKGIRAVLESLSGCEGIQVWVTSHSPVVVALTPKEQLLCLRQTKEGATVQRGDSHPMLAKWQGIPDLGTLFSGGVL